VITDGDWDFFRPAKSYEEYYDGQAQSLLHGRIDVPMQSILAERFERNGKYYGYFGPTPALPRMVLNLLMPSMYGRWSRLSMLLGSLFGMTMVLHLCGLLERLFGVEGRLWTVLRCLLLVGLFLGSTNLFLSAESMVYQESIMWASALALAHAVFLVQYLLEPRFKWLVVSCVLAFLAFNAKISSGAGPLVALSFVDLALILPLVGFKRFWAIPEGPLQRRAILLVTATLLVSAGSWAGLNYWKFGMVFTSQPLLLTPHPDPVRLQRIKGDPFSLTNIPLTLSIYLPPSTIRFRPQFPWAFLVSSDANTERRMMARFPNSHYDGFEPVASITATMPVLFLCAVGALLLAFAGRRPGLAAFRAPLMGSVAGVFLILGWGYISQRFLHDAFPWIAMGSTLMVAYVASLPGKPIRVAATVLLAIGTLYGMWVNAAFAIMHLRVDTIRPDTDAKRVAFLDFAQDATLHGIGGAWKNLTQWRKYIPASEFRRGNVTAGNTTYTSRSDVSVIWYDGVPPGLVEYALDFPKAGRYEIAMLYASPDSRPLDLVVNGKPLLRGLCGAPTGGVSLNNERWCTLSFVRVNAESSSWTLASEGKFPIVRMIRITQVE
jgi:hypothetical protein